MHTLFLSVGSERKKQGRVGKNENERQHKGTKLLLLKMEGNGVVIGGLMLE